MEEFSKEDQEFRDMLTGRRKGTRGQEALRAELIAAAKVVAEAQEAAYQPLTEDETTQREALRARLIGSGAALQGPSPVATAAPSSDARTRRPDGASWGGWLSGLFGVGQGGGIRVFGVPAGAMAMLCFAAVFVVWQFQRPAAEDDGLRGASNEITAIDPAAKCDQLKKSLITIGVEESQISEPPLKEGCAIILRIPDKAVQIRAADVFRQAGFKSVDPGEVMDILVRPRR